MKLQAYGWWIHYYTNGSPELISKTTLEKTLGEIGHAIIVHNSYAILTIAYLEAAKYYRLYTEAAEYCYIGENFSPYFSLKNALQKIDRDDFELTLYDWIASSL